VIFENNSNCYADAGQFENDGIYAEGEVIMAMDCERFVKVICELTKERRKCIGES
jgi:hypothetical protein